MRPKLLVLLLLLAAPSLAGAAGSAQWTRDRDATLVSKDVGAERWAITYRLSDSRVTGNVFRSDGGPSSFLQCDKTGGDSTNLTLDCYGASACGGAPCPSSQYTLIASGVSLPVSFFYPPGDGPSQNPTVADLLGTWHFVVTTSQTTADFTYRFTTVEQSSDGDVVFGTATDSGNRIYAAMASGSTFAAFDESEFGCNAYVFTFTTPNHVEGSEFLTAFSSTDQICTAQRINDVTNTFVGDRVGG